MLQVFGVDQFLRAGDARPASGIPHTLLLLRRLQHAAEQGRPLHDTGLGRFLSVSSRVGLRFQPSVELVQNLLPIFLRPSRSHIELPLEAATTPGLPGMPMQCPYQSQYGTSPVAPLSPSDSTTSGGKLNPATYYPPHGVTGLPQQPRQKGRPRKRKPKDIEAMTASLGKFFFVGYLLLF